MGDKLLETVPVQAEEIGIFASVLHHPANIVRARIRGRAHAPVILLGYVGTGNIRNYRRSKQAGGADHEGTSIHSQRHRQSIHARSLLLLLCREGSVGDDRLAVVRRHPGDD